LSAHQHLRAATRAAHDRVDAHFAGYDLAEARQYRDFLLAHAVAFIPAEQAIEDAGGNAIPGFEGSRRSDALLEDLSDLGLKLPQSKTFRALQTWPEVLGSAYVLEGSRLGGAVLVRQVGADLPRRFLSARPPGGHWRAFVAYLDQHLADERAIADATRSALETFALFEPEAIGAGQ
jgi:heme oxygenase